MSQKQRRLFIKGIGISVPTAWIAPVIQTFTLPAHAATSPGADSCTITSGCYEVLDSFQTILTVNWPGNSTKEVASYHEQLSCGGSAQITNTSVIAPYTGNAEVDQAAAEAVWGEGAPTNFNVIMPIVGRSCAFYTVD